MTERDDVEPGHQFSLILIKVQDAMLRKLLNDVVSQLHMSSHSFIKSPAGSCKHQLAPEDMLPTNTLKSVRTLLHLFTWILQGAKGLANAAATDAPKPPGRCCIRNCA
jgi:hypothetical protein